MMMDCMIFKLTSGLHHKLTSLGELVEALSEKINKVKEEMSAKEEKLELLFKLASKAVSEYDDETNEIIKRLQTARDEQVH